MDRQRIQEGAAPDTTSGDSGGGRAVVLGEFELREEIGRGGMGTVFAAWQRSLNRTVALKVLAQQVSASPNAVRRFQREAQAAAKLNHTHITPIFAQGQERGVYYYAMELVDGPSLAAVLTEARGGVGESERPTEPEETVVLVRGESAGAAGAAARSTGKADSSSDSERRALCRGLGAQLGRPRTLEQFAAVARHVASIADALDYAHRQGVVHRDIKPHNLLFGGDGRLRITDFGLARLSAEPGVTMTGEMVGSPLYMSPEQILEERESIDHRTDIYSLGATLYEWLTGRPPFPGDTRERVIRQISSSEAEPPRALRPEIPVALETICLKAMERERRRRYATAGAFRDDLQRFLDSQPIHARRASAGVRLRRFVARHPVTVLAAAALMVAVSLSLVLFRQRTEIVSKTQTLEEVTGQALQAKQDYDRLLNLAAPLMMEGLPIEAGAPLTIARKMLPTVQSLLGGAASGEKKAQEPSGPPTELLGTPEGISRRASREFFESLESAAAAPGDEFGALLDKARALGASDPRAALTLVEAYLAQRPQDKAALLLAEGLYARLGDYDAMEAGAEKLLALEHDNPDALFGRGVARFLRGETEPGLADMVQAARLERLVPWARLFRSLLLLQMGQTMEAVGHLNEALRQAPDLKAPRLARSLAHAVAWAHSSEGDHMHQAVRDLTEVLSVEPENAELLTLRGQYYGAIGDFAAAARDFDAALDLVGHSAELIAKLSIAQFAQARSEASAASPPTGEGAPDAKNLPAGAGGEKDITTQSMQDWFSRFVYPGVSDPGGSFAPSPSALSPPRFAPVAPPPAAPHPPRASATEPPSPSDAGTGDALGEGADARRDGAPSSGGASEEQSGASSNAGGGRSRGSVVVP